MSPGSDSGGKRRIPRRYVLLAVVLLAIGLSERYDGPFTVVAVGSTVGAAIDGVIDRFERRPDLGEIHLTFDDGPSLDATPQVLDLLDKYDATVVFFPIGNQVDNGAALLRRAVEEGHRIGNHTWNHDSLLGISAPDFDSTVGRTQDVIERATGVAPTCLRPPGGKVDDNARALASAAGLSVELWTVDPQDWRREGPSTIEAGVVDLAEPGDVVLLHDGGGDREQTIAALDGILDRLSDAGYRFTAMPGC